MQKTISGTKNTVGSGSERDLCIYRLKSVD